MPCRLLLHRLQLKNLCGNLLLAPSMSLPNTTRMRAPEYKLSLGGSGWPKPSYAEAIIRDLDCSLMRLCVETTIAIACASGATADASCNGGKKNIS
jgi:hypothetical protein